MNDAAETRGSARAQILATAAALFYEEGFRAVGIDTIIARSGVAKMTLYRHFPSKDALIAAYLEDANARFWVWFDEALGEGGPRAQLEQLFDAVGVLANHPTCLGCTFQSSAAEFPDPSHSGHAVAIAHKRAVAGRLAALAEAAGAHDAHGLAAQLLLLMDGAWAAARMFGPANHAAQVGDAARALISAAYAR
jgi:AcrR family transcriptional regulator